MDRQAVRVRDTDSIRAPEKRASHAREGGGPPEFPSGKACFHSPGKAFSELFSHKEPRVPKLRTLAALQPSTPRVAVPAVSGAVVKGIPKGGKAELKSLRLRGRDWSHSNTHRAQLWTPPLEGWGKGQRGTGVLVVLDGVAQLTLQGGRSWAGGSSKQGKSVVRGGWCGRGDGEFEKGVLRSSGGCERPPKYWAFLQHNPQRRGMNI